MGLIKCLDCKKKFSDRIESCPKCGCPKSEIMKVTFTKAPLPVEQIKTEEPLRRRKKPTNKKSVLIVLILLFVSFANFAHPYMEVEFFYNYALVLGWIDFVIFSIWMMATPIIYGIVKRKCDLKKIKRISFINSLLLFVLSIIVLVMTDVLYVGWVIILMYYFINKHLLILMRSNASHRRYRKKTTATTTIILLLLVASVIASMLFTQKEFAMVEDKRIVIQPFNER